MSAEADFYKAHYGGGVGVGATPHKVFAREMLAPGKRYGLVTEHLTRDYGSGGCLVEIGCGGGEALIILSESRQFDRIVGVDIALDPRCLQPGTTAGLEFVNSNLNEKWPLADNEVDHLIAMMVIEHLFDPFHAFQEIQRCLSARGAAYVNLPLVTGLRNRIRLLFGILPETSTSYEQWFQKREWDGNHLHYFSLRSIHDLARSCGLRVTEVRGVGALYQLKTRFPSLLAAEVTFRMQHIN
jgi:cyclopropane fatty-acyl-phospholipid synthase-like methyltransferase